jgi:protein-L-isoaspartate(D-aspartate) O-methyltransferase
MERRRARNRLVDALDVELASTDAALRAVPRHQFVPEAWRHFAYADRPVPIGEGATISAPSVVAAMVDHLALSPGDRVLEIGTGSGYHAAVVAEVLGPENVYSVEYDQELAASARERLDSLGYGDVSIRVGDGREGWPEHAPYDAAYATCAARDFPPAVVDQVRLEGLLLFPIGIVETRLVLAKKTSSDALDRLDCGPVQFVPMRGPESDTDTVFDTDTKNDMDGTTESSSNDRGENTE